MKRGNNFTKKDIVIVLVCIIFLIANISAIGDNGRRRAKQALCLANLMKWGQVFHAYTADNDGYFHARSVGNPVGYSRIWIYFYEPYYRDPMMRYCPAAVDRSLKTGPFGTWNLNFGAWNPDDPEYCGPNPPYDGSYGINRYIPNLVGQGMENDPVYWRRAGIKGASQVPVLTDCQFVAYYARPTSSPPPYDGAFENEMQWACINRHEGFINACFMDFSARKVGLKELWTLKYSRTFDTCGPWTTCGGVQPSQWPQWMQGFEDY